MKDAIGQQQFDPAFKFWYKWVLATGLGISVVYLIVDLVGASNQLKVWMDVFTIMVDSLALVLALRFGRYLEGSLLAVIMGQVCLTIACIIQGGIYSPFLPYYFITVMASNLLFNGGYKWVVLVLNAIGIASIFVVQQIFPEFIQHADFGLWYYLINYFIVLMMLFWGTSGAKRFLVKQQEELTKTNNQINSQNLVLQNQKEEISSLNKHLQTELNKRSSQLSDALQDVSSREAYLRSLLESQTTFLVRIDLEGKILFLNKAFQELFSDGLGFRRKGLLTDLIHVEDRDSLRNVLQKFELGQVHAMKQMLRIYPEKEVDSHSMIYVDWEFLFVRNNIDGAIEIQGVGTNITDRMIAQRKLEDNAAVLEKLTEDLIRRNNELTDFGYMVSHNLRGPVANIVGLSDLFSDGEANSSNDIIVDKIKLAADKLDSVIKDLNKVIDLRNTRDSDFEFMYLNDLLGEVLYQIEEKISLQNGKVTGNFSGCPALWLVKPYAFSILYNLLTNSLKYRHPERRPEIDISSIKRKDLVEIIVSDNGIGIDLEKNGRKIFRLYQRFHEHVEGKGMGLHMVKVQVEAMNGKIEVKSRPQEGTSFHIFFPISFATNKEDLSQVSLPLSEVK
ncbi:MAG: PAS domain-containing sensor histidine kinase [Bacteroidota bacterium]